MPDLDPDFVAFASIVIAALGGAVKWIFWRMDKRAAVRHALAEKRDAERRKAEKDQWEKLKTLEELLERADHQLHPNSGKSIADKVDRIEAMVSADRDAREAAIRAAHEAAARAELAVARAEEAVSRAERRPMFSRRR